MKLSSEKIMKRFDQLLESTINPKTNVMFPDELLTISKSKFLSKLQNGVNLSISFDEWDIIESFKSEFELFEYLYKFSSIDSTPIIHMQYDELNQIYMNDKMFYEKAIEKMEPYITAKALKVIL